MASLISLLVSIRFMILIFQQRPSCNMIYMCFINKLNYLFYMMPQNSYTCASVISTITLEMYQLKNHNRKYVIVICKIIYYINMSIHPAVASK